MLFEDAHWSDPTSLELLDLIVERVPALPSAADRHLPAGVHPALDRPAARHLAAASTAWRRGSGPR